MHCRIPCGPSGNSLVVIFAITDGYLCMMGSFRMIGEGGCVRGWDTAVLRG